jgi:CubicO group peptidase (beta-lactamase class C family)
MGLITTAFLTIFKIPAMKKINVLLLLLSWISLNSCVEQTAIEKVDPATVEMSSARLDNIDSMIQGSIDNQWINGAVAYIARNGKIAYWKSFGVSNAEKKTPLEKDAIFRIASQTKAITSVAVMMLYEEGKFLLDDPISKYITEFAHPAVLDQFNPKDTTYTTVPANREITIRDLLTHTSGIDYAGIGSSNMNAIYAKAGIPVGFESRPLILADGIRKLGRLPLVHQPGERFTYGLNTDVLGYLVEVASGMPFDRFLKERLFEPLGMEDTYFYLPEEKQSRLIAVSTEDSGHHAVAWDAKVLPGIDANYPLVKGTYFSGGAGLSSTISDYAIFLQMLLNNGEYNGKRILSRRTVDLMTCNQIGDLNLGLDKFGLGFEITTEAGQARQGVSEGSFAWGGFWGTTYWADPEEQLVCLLFTQQFPLSHGELGDKFRALVYAALDD